MEVAEEDHTLEDAVCAPRRYSSTHIMLYTLLLQNIILNFWKQNIILVQTNVSQLLIEKEICPNNMLS
jgi:hypothetical protein